jgi:hypothetical protein
MHAEYTSMLLGIHAIWGSAAAPTAEHQRRRPRMAGHRAGKQNRRFIGALVKRFGHFSDLFLHLVALHGRKTKPKPRPCHCPRETKTHFIVVCAWLTRDASATSTSRCQPHRLHQQPELLRPN